MNIKKSKWRNQFLNKNKKIIISVDLNKQINYFLTSKPLKIQILYDQLTYTSRSKYLVFNHLLDSVFIVKSC